MTDKTTSFDPMTATHVPLSERMLDRLADILVASDDILDMIRMGGETPPGDVHTSAVMASVRRVYDEINGLMMQMVD